MNHFIIDRQYAILMEALGTSLEEVLKVAKLPQDLLQHKVMTLTVEEYFRILQTIEQLAGDEIGLTKLGDLIALETFSPVIFAAYCSKNALVCMKRMAQYKKLIGPMECVIHESAECVEVEMKMADASYELPRILVEIEMIFVLSLIRKASNSCIVPREVWMKKPAKYLRDKAFLGVTPQLGIGNKIIFKREDLAIPFMSQNDTMWSYFEPELKRRLSEMEIEDTFSARVRSALIELLPGGSSGIEEVAEKLGCTKRTLQRRLKEEDTSYQKQLNHTRELLAKHYLKHIDLSTDEIAYLLGYQDLSSFTRAFTTWTGMSISEYKRT